MPQADGLKQITLGAAKVLGLLSWLRRAHRRDLLVLCYHGVVAVPKPDDRRYRNCVSRSQFQWQMEFLARHFHPISTGQLRDCLQTRRPWPERSALVTFDDGYQNNLSQAAPVLKQLGIPALFSLSAGYVGQDRLLWTQELEERILHWTAVTLPAPDGRDLPLAKSRNERHYLACQLRERCKRLPCADLEQYLEHLRQQDSEPLPLLPELYAFLSWDEARQLRDQGFEFASHTLEHRILTNLEPQAVATELHESKRILERELGQPCPYLVYPQGGAQDVSAEIMRQAAEADYELAFTLMQGLNRKIPNPLAIDRLAVPGQPARNTFRALVAGAL